MDHMTSHKSLKNKSLTFKVKMENGELVINTGSFSTLKNSTGPEKNQEKLKKDQSPKRNMKSKALWNSNEAFQSAMAERSLV
ncbi:hypothetical protein ACFX2A_013829 [Malus domestica]